MHIKTETIGRKLSIMAILSWILLPSFLVSASPATSTVSLSSGDVSLVLGVKVRLMCTLPVELTPPSSTIRPGETQTWRVKINAPMTVSISVYIPSPVSNWYSASQDFTSLSSLYIPIISGLSATLRISPSTSLNATGPATLSTYSSISFDYLGSGESFYVTSYSSASNGQRITVDADFALDISVGLSITLFSFSQQIASTRIGQFSMNPELSESITISTPNPLFDMLTNLGFWLIVLGVAILVSIMAIVARRNRIRQDKRKARPSVPIAQQAGTLPQKPSEQPKPVTSPTVSQEKASKPGIVHCIYCGEALPQHAVYCRKCGRRME